MLPQQSFVSASPLAFPTIQRSTPRVFVRMPAWVSVDSDCRTEHVAFVRDISDKGLMQARTSNSYWNT